MLHPDDPGIPFLMDALEHILIVDLTGGEFLSSRIIANLEIGTLVPGTFDIGNQVTEAIDVYDSAGNQSTTTERFIPTGVSAVSVSPRA